MTPTVRDLLEAICHSMATGSPQTKVEVSIKRLNEQEAKAALMDSLRVLAALTGATAKTFGRDHMHVIDKLDEMSPPSE